MAGTTTEKVRSTNAASGPDGQVRLASGAQVAMRMWRNETPHHKDPVRRDYETVGYVVSGRAELDLEGRTLTLEPGDSWLVPAGAEHTYRIIETFTAVEATSAAGRYAGTRDDLSRASRLAPPAFTWRGTVQVAGGRAGPRPSPVLRSAART